MTNNRITNILGAVLAFLIAIQPMLTEEGFNLRTDWINLVVAGLIAGLSYYIGKKPK